MSAQGSTWPLIRLDFQVWGRVQGVFFRKCTQSEAKKVGVRGWIRNTPQHTVEGQLEGQPAQVDHMMTA